MNAALQKQKPTQQKHKKLEEEIECSKHLQAPKKKKKPLNPTTPWKLKTKGKVGGGKKNPRTVVKTENPKPPPPPQQQQQ